MSANGDADDADLPVRMLDGSVVYLSRIVRVSLHKTNVASFRGGVTFWKIHFEAKIGSNRRTFCVPGPPTTKERAVATALALCDGAMQCGSDALAPTVELD